MAVKDILVPLAAPAIQGILNVLDLMKLKPLSNWQLDKDIALGVTYVLSLVGAAIAYKLDLRSHIKQRWYIGISGFLFVCAFWVYNHISTTPPTTSTIVFYDVLAILSYCATYIFFGAVISLIIKD